MKVATENAKLALELSLIFGLKALVLGGLLFLLLLAFQSTAQPLARAEKIAAAPITCDVNAYVIDPDPKGLNVRSGPGRTHMIVGTLPHSEDGVTVHIVGAQGDWVLIENPENLDDTDNQELPKLKGWVYAPMLGTSTRQTRSGKVNLYESPNRKSRIVGKAPFEAEVSLQSCRGTWAQVKYKQTMGWLDQESQCGSPVTTCP